MYIGEVIKRYRSEHKLSMQDFANISGLSKAYIGLLEKIYNSSNGQPIAPSIPKVKAIANAMGMELDELLQVIDGNQPVTVNTNQQQDDINFNKSFNIFNYAHYPVGISAGQLQEVDSLYNVPKIPIPDVMMGRYARNKNICIMHVNGESMNNVIDDGAVIAVQRNIELSQLKNGDIVVADNGKGEYTVKRFYLQEDGVVLLRPDSSNISFTDIKIDIKNGEQVNIFGKVVIYNVIL